MLASALSQGLSERDFYLVLEDELRLSGLRLSDCTNRCVGRGVDRPADRRPGRGASRRVGRFAMLVAMLVVVLVALPVDTVCTSGFTL